MKSGSGFSLLAGATALLAWVPVARADFQAADVPARPPLALASLVRTDALHDFADAAPIETTDLSSPAARMRMPAVDPLIDHLLSSCAAAVPVPTGVGSDDLSPLSRGPVVQEIPPPPGGATLLLSALASVGAWQLVRSARHVSLAHLPAWYHAGAAKIGHAVPFDFDFNALPLCCFQQPVGERPVFFPDRRELRPRRDAQCFPIIAAPRAPPTL